MARRLSDVGTPIAAVLSRRDTSAQRLAEQVGAPVASSDVAALPEQTRMVMLCVPDDAIAEAAAALAEVEHPWADTVAAHTSGARAAAELSALAERGASTLSIHPMQTFTADTDPSAFEDVVIGVEGRNDALAAGAAMARRLGGTPVRLSSEDKIRYHCAAALASNGLVALMAVVRDVLATAGIEGENAQQLVRPLVEQTWENLQSGTPESVLTGPVARGDQGTIRNHLDALTDAAPHLVALYADLSEEMLRLAVRDGRLDRGEAEAMHATIAEMRSEEENRSSSLLNV